MPRTRPALVCLALLIVLGIPALALADDPKPSADDDPPPPTSEPSPVRADDDPKPDDTPKPDRPRRVGPVVRSAAEVADLLRDPDADPYAEAIDWRTVPPWQRTRFYGIRAKGTFFVFVVDCSGSMADDLRFERAKQELRRCVGAMRFPQRYLIIFYNDRPIPMSGGVPRSSEQRDKLRTYAWLNSVDAVGGTDPRGAMNLALNLEPDAVFLLSDGEFPPGTEPGIAATNSQKTPIHCIDLAGGPGADQLRTIARQSGGRYTLKP